MGLRVDPGVPLGAGAALPELMEDVRDLFTAASSAEFVPRFRVPGLGNGGWILKGSLPIEQFNCNWSRNR